jgi:hypothetical protein
MTIDDCLEPGHIISRAYSDTRNAREYEKYRLRILSTPLPAGSFIENVEFYLRKNTLRRKYDLFKYNVEDLFSRIFYLNKNI